MATEQANPPQRINPSHASKRTKARLASGDDFLKTARRRTVFGTAKFITLEAAKKMAAAGEAEARKNGWNGGIAIVDAGGVQIVFEKLDETQPGRVAVAPGKARAAALFKRPLESMEEAIVDGKLAVLSVEAIVPMQGRVPVVVEDKVICAVSVSGVTSAQDEQVAQVALGGLSR